MKLKNAALTLIMIAVPPKLVSSNAFAPFGASLGKFTPSELVLK